MKLNDPARQLIAGRPALIPPVGVIPMLQVFPKGALTVQIGAFLMTAPNEATWHEATIDTSDLPQILADYGDDPESVLCGLLKWIPPATKSMPSKLSLEDLGL